MPTSYTSLLGLALPVTGELSGTWGDTVNDYLTKYLDAAVAGAQTISGSQTAVTLTTTNGSTLTQAGSGSTGSAQYQIINCTGNPASLLTITVPAQSKAYLVLNATSTSQSVKVVGAGPTTGVTMVSGEKALIAWDGSDFVKVASSTADGVTTLSFGTTGLTPNSATAGAITVAGTLVAANGGTGQSSYTTGDLLYATGSTALSKLGIGTNGQVLTSTGTAPQWSTLSGVAVTTFSAGTTGFTPSTATSGAVTLAGTLATTNGGTGLTSFTANRVFYASSTSAIAQSANLTFDGTTLTAAGFSGPLNGTVGATTPNTGSFTTLTTSSTVTINGGTANCVAYLNGSKVLSAGVNLTFNGSTLGVGSGLDLGLASATPTITFNSNGSFRASLSYSNSTGAVTLNNAYGPFAVSVGSGGSSSEGMRLTSTGLGVGTSSPASRLTISGTSTGAWLTINRTDSGTNIVDFTESGSRLGYIGYSGSTLNILQAQAASIVFSTSGSSRATIDSSGNFGLGVTSPLFRFDARGASGTGISYIETTTGNTNRIQLGATTGAGYINATAGSGSPVLQLQVADSTRATLDSSGNLGLGVTPSAWGSTWRVLDAGNLSSFANNTGSSVTDIWHNAFVNSGGVPTYKTTAAAGFYRLEGGTFKWFNASSGTAGTTATFTQVMTLDADGDLGIGTTSPGQKLTVQGGITVTSSATLPVAQGSMLFSYEAPINRIYMGDGTGYSFAFSKRASSTTTDLMTLTDGGNLGIGTSSPTTKLDVKQSGANWYDGIEVVRSTTDNQRLVLGNTSGASWIASVDAAGGSNNAMIFGRSTNGTTFTESARFDSSGNLGIGTSSPGYPLDVNGAGRFGATSSVSLYFNSNLRHTNASGSALYLDVCAGGAAGDLIIRNSSSFTTQLTLSSGGNLGLGVTPSAWGSSERFIDVGNSVAFGRSSAGGGAVVAYNAFINSSGQIIYKINAHATYYQSVLGQHQWYTAASGTAGNIISFTQAMTLSAANNLLVGVTTDTASARAVVGGTVISTTNTVSTFSGDYAGFDRTSSKNMRIFSGSSDATGSSIEFYAGVSGSVAERARITSVGNMSLGGTANRGTTVGTNALQIFNGTAPAGTLTNGVSLYSSSGDLFFMDAAGTASRVGFRGVPQSGSAKTGSYTLATTDVGDYIEVGSGGSITIPDATFSTGDVVSIFNNTTGNITITCSITTAYIAGTDSDKATMTLATRGVATVLFISSTICVVTGNVS
jgi:hypothetical protein